MPSYVRVMMSEGSNSAKPPRTVNINFSCEAPDAAACIPWPNLRFSKRRRSLGAGAMAQPSSKIAEACCGREQGREGDAKLRGDSVSSKSSLDPLTCADAEASVQSQQHDTEELAEVSRALAALREAVTPLAPEGRAQLSRMAPGVGGFNIDAPTAEPTNR